MRAAVLYWKLFAFTAVTGVDQVDQAQPQLSLSPKSESYYFTQKRYNAAATTTTMPTRGIITIASNNHNLLTTTTTTTATNKQIRKSAHDCRVLCCSCCCCCRWLCPIGICVCTMMIMANMFGWSRTLYEVRHWHLVARTRWWATKIGFPF